MKKIRGEKKLNKEERKTLIEKETKRIKNLSYKLKKHTERNKNTNHINRKIFHLITSPFTFVNAYAKISKNRGALTLGYKEDKSIELFGLKKAINIAEKIKKNKYNFKPVKRTWVPKPGKNKMRPIDVPTQSDRIVQEAVRAILEAIYEPEFLEFEKQTNNLSSNYGFRPNLSTWTAVNTLYEKTKRCNIVIEGDIVSAYNHVDHDLLLEILQKRIKDRKFINFIKKMLKSGIMDGQRFEHSLKGTPQGGIISPLLFNIYLLGFDKYIYNEFIVPILEDNKTKKEDIASKEYGKINRLYKKALRELRETKTKDKALQKTALKKFKNIRALRNRTPYGDIQRLKKGAVYVRYADDWVLALTATKAEVEEIKYKISNYLKEERKMLLDKDKTKIAQMGKGYKFLGFEIRMDVRKPKLKRVLLKDKNGNYQRPLRRTTSRIITIEPDKDRILQRLKLLKVSDKNNQPQAKPEWIIYEEFEIVLKYTQVFRGIYNYFEPCGKLTRLNQISYILQYSCAKTLARRKKLSIRKIFELYGKNLEMKKIIKGTAKEITRTVSFLTLTNLRGMKTERNPNLTEELDPFRTQEHLRTKMKVYNECCICGEIDDISLHHINSLRSVKKQKRDRYEHIRSQVNRLQIPVCYNCHQEITHGKYNDPKTPIEFYNEFLAKL